MPRGSFYSRKGVATVAHRRWKGLQCGELIARVTGQDAFNAPLRCPLALSGTGVRLVPSVAAPSRFDTRPGQRCVRYHVGRQAAEVARWQGLHEDLHATTQVLAELVWKPRVATQVPAQQLHANGGEALAGAGLAVALLASSVRALKDICPRGNNKVIIYFLIS